MISDLIWDGSVFPGRMYRASWKSYRKRWASFEYLIHAFISSRNEAHPHEFPDKLLQIPRQTLISTTMPKTANLIKNTLRSVSVECTPCLVHRAHNFEKPTPTNFQLKNYEQGDQDSNIVKRRKRVMIGGHKNKPYRANSASPFGLLTLCIYSDLYNPLILLEWISIKGDR